MLRLTTMLPKVTTEGLPAMLTLWGLSYHCFGCLLIDIKWDVQLWLRCTFGRKLCCTIMLGFNVRDALESYRECPKETDGLLPDAAAEVKVLCCPWCVACWGWFSMLNSGKQLLGEVECCSCSLCYVMKFGVEPCCLKPLAGKCQGGMILSAISQWTGIVTD
ncbi:hypothetical protein Nepgr_008095 [Nepenthes gracilis]|uniref:Uncharacterized protein n=1 Tax=Nepenthes gracilis TaxID=150966 RepID=A0AAD3XJ25_NEPGR|nr:hypothetical protein Nepgr_008095 [Nepenthes gracilis]